MDIPSAYPTCMHAGILNPAALARKAERMGWIHKPEPRKFEARAPQNKKELLAKAAPRPAKHYPQAFEVPN